MPTWIATVGAELRNLNPLISLGVVHLSTAQLIWVTIGATHHIQLTLREKHSFSFNGRCTKAAPGLETVPLPLAQPSGSELVEYAWERWKSSSPSLGHNTPQSSSTLPCYSHLDRYHMYIRSAHLAPVSMNDNSLSHLMSYYICDAYILYLFFSSSTTINTLNVCFAKFAWMALQGTHGIF